MAENSNENLVAGSATTDNNGDTSTETSDRPQDGDQQVNPVQGNTTTDNDDSSTETSQNGQQVNQDLEAQIMKGIEDGSITYGWFDSIFDGINNVIEKKMKEFYDNNKDDIIFPVLKKYFEENTLIFFEKMFDLLKSDNELSRNQAITAMRKAYDNFTDYKTILTNLKQNHSTQLGSKGTKLIGLMKLVSLESLATIIAGLSRKKPITDEKPNKAYIDQRFIEDVSNLSQQSLHIIKNILLYSTSYQGTVKGSSNLLKQIASSSSDFILDVRSFMKAQLFQKGKKLDQSGETAFSTASLGIYAIGLALTYLDHFETLPENDDVQALNTVIESLINDHGSRIITDFTTLIVEATGGGNIKDIVTRLLLVTKNIPNASYEVYIKTIKELLPVKTLETISSKELAQKLYGLVYPFSQLLFSMTLESPATEDVSTLVKRNLDLSVKVLEELLQNIKKVVELVPNSTSTSQANLAVDILVKIVGAVKDVSNINFE